MQYCVSSYCATTWISYVYTYSLPLKIPPPLPHPASLGRHRELSWAPCTTQQLPYWLSILHMVVRICQCYSLHLSHPLLFPPVTTSSCSVSAFLFLPWKSVHQNHFSRFSIYASIYICFSLSDLIHSEHRNTDLEKIKRRLCNNIFSVKSMYSFQN